MRNLSAGYGHVRVLFGVSFSLARSETVALLGANGAGKTTLLRALGGLLLPTEGVVRLNGRAITFTEPETRFRLGMVQLRGGEGTFAPLSVGDNLRAVADRRQASVAPRCWSARRRCWPSSPPSPSASPIPPGTSQAVSVRCWRWR